MSNSYLFLSLFFMQGLIISFFLPVLLVKKIQDVINQHPEKNYPKMYPVPARKIQDGLRRFLTINQFIFAIGLLIIVHAFSTQAADLLGWDNKAVVSVFFFVQIMPLIFAQISGFAFFKAMRQANLSNKRVASLALKSWTDFVSPTMIAAVVVTEILFVGLVEYFQRHSFPGYGGYTNLAILLVSNIILIGTIYWAIYGRKVDPLQPEQVRKNQIQTIVNLCLFSSIFGLAFAMLNLLLASSQFRPYIDLSICIYNSLLVIAGYRLFINIDFDFEVYKNNNEKLV
jgi:hypothetical protein